MADPSRRPRPARRVLLAAVALLIAAAALSGCEAITGVARPFTCEAVAKSKTEDLRFASRAEVIRVRAGTGSGIKVSGRYTGSKPSIRRSDPDVYEEDSLMQIPGEPGDGAGGSATLCALGPDVVWSLTVLAKNSRRVFMDFSDVGVSYVTMNATGDSDMRFSDATFDIVEPRSKIEVFVQAATPASTMTIRVPDTVQVLVYAHRKPAADAKSIEPYADIPGWSIGNASGHRVRVGFLQREPNVRVIRYATP